MSEEKTYEQKVEEAVIAHYKTYFPYTEKEYVGNSAISNSFKAGAKWANANPPPPKHAKHFKKWRR